MNLKNWDDFYSLKQLLIISDIKINEKTKIFAMGSCFAAELFKALKSKQYECFPKYTNIKVYPGQIFDKIPFERDFIAHYDTYSIKQEIESAANIWTNEERESGFYEVRNSPVNKMLSAESVWQDPHRKLCYATSKPLLSDLSKKITFQIHEGLKESDILIFTLGLIESWISKLNNKAFCRPPNTGYGGGDGLAEFYLSTFEDNYKNTEELIKLINKNYPNKKIIISVSPVALQFTFTNNDVYTANMYSKSILRSVAGKICDKFSNVTYFPAYEIANLLPHNEVYQEDGRHVKSSFAEIVMNSFIARFSVD